MARVPWVITLVDRHAGWRYASAPALVKAGVPLPVAVRWAAERRAITTGLKRRVKESVN